MFWLRFFLIPLVITVIAEELTALVWGYRSVKDLLTVLWINAATNLSVTALRYLSNQLIHFKGSYTVTVIVLECLVVLTEWRLFKRLLSRCPHPFIFSLVMNAVSYAAGYLLPVIAKVF